MAKQTFFSRKAIGGAAALLAGVVGNAHADFSVAGRNILLDGERFTVRGVCYQPTPIGGNPSRSAPFGDYFTAGGINGDFRDIYDRDLVNMREMGANLVRVYSWNTNTDHSDFLDKAYNGGRDPIYVLLNRWIQPATDWEDSNAVSALANSFAAIASNVGDHPAILGISIGNEANVENGNAGNPAFWNAMNEIAGAIKEVNAEMLVTTSIAEGIGSINRYDSQAQLNNIDFWSLQIYRGVTFTDLFTSFSSASEKPMILTEFGIDAFDNRIGAEFPDNAATVATVFTSLWSEILANRTVTSGGCFFAYSDEYWKAPGSPFVQDPGGFNQGGFPDQFSNEEWYGIFALVDNGLEPDILHPRAIFETLKATWRIPEPVEAAAALQDDQWSIVFIRDPGRPDLRYGVETSNNLVDWELIAASEEGELTRSLREESVVVSETTSGQMKVVTVTSSGGGSASESSFVRITIVES